MSAARFLEIIPVLGVGNMAAAIQFYTEKLGFSLRFHDDPEDPRYVVVARDAVRLHLQWHNLTNINDQIEPVQLRFLVDDVDSLFAEYKNKEVFPKRTNLADTSWATREFAFYDLDGNGLFFYRNR